MVTEMKWGTWFAGLADIVMGYACTFYGIKFWDVSDPWHKALYVTGAVVSLVRGAVKQVNSRRDK